MSLLEQVKADALAARKASINASSEVDKAKGQYVAGSLIAFLSAVEMVGKNGNRDVTDADVVNTAKSFIKSIKECLKVATDGSERKKLYEIELACLERYLPAQLTEDQIKAELQKIQPSNLGTAMSHFKTNFTGQYDNLVLKNAAEAYIRGDHVVIIG